MSIYNPDKWVMLKIVSPQGGTIYKIMASWYGGFSGSDSWKLSSGTVSQKDSDNGLPLCREYLQDTGSIYKVTRNNYGMSGYTTGVYNTFIDQVKNMPGVTIDLLVLEDVWALDPSVFGAWKD